jgi:hypothetical protein
MSSSKVFFRIGPEPRRAIRLGEKGFSLLLPDDQTVVGIALLLDGYRVALDHHHISSSESFEGKALARRIGVLHPTGNPLDFFFDVKTLHDVAVRIMNRMSTGGSRNGGRAITT